MEEGIHHIELLNRSVMGDSSGEHYAHNDRFHNRVESLVIVNFGALSETRRTQRAL
jgi:hypothetical protein